MKIQLKNFKNHENGSFTIPDKGLILLFGINGSGKSSLLNGIFYALYGKVKKPFSHGKTTCEVSLEYKDICITRTTNPNKLTVKIKGITYENERAQHEINRYIGMSLDEFKNSSYASQDNTNSVLAMTPADQLRFVETLTFKDDEHKLIKDQIKSLSKSAEEKLKIIEGELKATKRYIKDKSSKLKDFEDFLENDEEFNISELKEQISNKQKTLERYQKKVEEYRKNLEKRKEQEKAKKQLLEEDSKLSAEIDQLNVLKEEVLSRSASSPEDIEQVKSEIDDLKKELANLKIYKSYRAERKRFEELKKLYFEDLQNSITKLKSSLKSDEELQEMKEELEKFESTREEQEALKRKILAHDQAVTNIEIVMKEMAEGGFVNKKIKKPTAYINFLERKMKPVEKQISNLQEEISTLEKRNLYKKWSDEDDIVGPLSCPCCDKELMFINSTRVLEVWKEEESNNTVSDEIIAEKKASLNLLEETKSNILRWIQVINNNLEAYEIVPGKTKVYENQEILELERAVRYELDTRQEIEELEEQELDASLKRVEADIKNKRKLLPRKYKSPGTQEELESQLQEKISIYEGYLRDERDLKNIERKIKSKLSDREKIKPLIREKQMKDTVEKLDKDYSMAQAFLSSVVREISDLQVKIDIARNIEEIRELQGLMEEKKKIKEEKVKREEEYKGSLGLLEAAKEAQLVAIEHTLCNINEYASHYLKMCFDRPIAVRLVTNHDALKTNKKHINTIVSYKGSDSGGFSDLSGGEKQKCELAFLLAVHDILGGKMLMLDERLNNMDTEINMEVLNFLKNCAQDKAIVVVSHEAVHGVFDEIVRL